MVSKEAVSEGAAKAEFPAAPVVAACLVPGGGHFWLRRWGRGAILLGTVVAMFAAGLLMEGRFFQFQPSNIVETLGFLGDLCAGLLFVAAKLAGYEGIASGSPMVDYGTKFLLVAGLLNVLCILDAYDIAVGNKD
ncbi:MAG: DUF6677 family protein [Terriglobia bacterium]